MKRPQRIRVVIAIGIGLFSLFTGYIGAPLILASTFHPQTASDDIDSMMQSMVQTSQMAATLNTIAIWCISIAGISFFWVLVEIGDWFIGPSETTKPSDSE